MFGFSIFLLLNITFACIASGLVTPTPTCNQVKCTYNNNMEKVRVIRAVTEQHDQLTPVNKTIELHNKNNTSSVVLHSENTLSTNKTLNKNDNSFQISNVPNSKLDIMQSGAFLRGFYVFIGLSVLVMMYFICRSYSLRRGGQSSNIVRKYGVKTRRSDMEMRPLELEEEDDETVFEVRSQSIKN